ncbi:MAG: phospholipid carrier-dependent glycosyltransferase, partial [Nanoarchaeota archaeon]
KEKIFKDKFVLCFLLLIIILGIFVRFEDYKNVGYWGDDMSAVPGSLFWFYPPYNYFPGLATNAAPPLGNLIIGAGCITSGEDFSQVRDIAPVFYPGREALVGKQMINAIGYCHAPMFIFGLLSLFGIIILAFTLLNRFSALWAVSFYAFYPGLLVMSRWIKEDIILFFLFILATYFCWKAYHADNNSKIEFFFFVVAAFLIGLAQATKWYGGALLALILSLLMDKNYESVKTFCKKAISKIDGSFNDESKINLSNPLKIGIASLVAFVIAALLPFKLSPSTFFSTLETYRKFNPAISTPSIDFVQLGRDFVFFFAHSNVIDTILLVIGALILIKILIKKDKKLYEKFLLYNLLTFLLAALFFGIAFELVRVFISYGIPIIFIMSLIFCEKSKLLSFFKNKKLAFGVFLFAYIIFSFAIAHNTVPYFDSENQIICAGANKICDGENNPNQFASGEIANKLKELLNDDETFISSNMEYYYLRQEESLLYYLWIQAFRNEFKREPSLIDAVETFRPLNRTVRYIVLNTKPNSGKFPKDEDLVRTQFQPNEIILLKNKEAAYIYDLKNLLPR